MEYTNAYKAAKKREREEKVEKCKARLWGAGLLFIGAVTLAVTHDLTIAVAAAFMGVVLIVASFTNI